MKKIYIDKVFVNKNNKQMSTVLPKKEIDKMMSSKIKPKFINFLLPTSKLPKETW